MKPLWAPHRMPYLRGEVEKVEGCLFCHKIDQDDAAEHILYRGEHAYVTLNRFPYNNGHMMIVPYRHTGALVDLKDPTLLEMMHLVQHAQCFLREVYGPDGFNFGVNEGSAAGAGVAEHIHLHLVPRWQDDANYMSVIGETRVIPQTLDETYRIFRARFDTLDEA